MNDTKISQVISFIGLAITIVMPFIKIYNLWPNGKIDDALLPAIFGISVGLAGYAYRIWARLSDTHKSTEKISKDINNITESTIAQSKEFSLRSTIDDYEPIASSASEKFVKWYYNDLIKANSHSLSIDSRNLPVYFNTIFWKELTDVQEQIKSGGGVITVNITHSEDIEFWDRDDAIGSLEQQAKFVAAKGKIQRIIQGPFAYEEVAGILKVQEQHEGVIKKYQDVITDMTRSGMDIFYVKNSQGSWPYDFAWVTFDKTISHPEMAMLWYLSNSIIWKCDLITDHEENSEMLSIRQKWGALSRRVRNGNVNPGS